MAKKYDNVTSVIGGPLYDYVVSHLEAVGDNNYKRNIANFFNKNHDKLYDTAPYDNIYYTATDIDNLFNSLNMKEKEVAEIMKGCFWYGKPFNPQLVKEPYIEVLVCLIIYYLRNKKQKEAEITAIYMAFSGKYYASIFGMNFPKAPPSKYRSTMDYVVNAMINNKFDLKKYGTIFGAIRSMCITVMDTYRDVLTKNPDDEDIKYFLQQFRDREISFMRNIASLYYNAFENKYYLNYESDDVSEDAKKYRITDSDATTAARITENTINYLLTNNVDLSICLEYKDINLKSTELRDIMESIVSEKAYINQMYRVCNILICDYMRSNPGGRINSVQFVDYSLREQPNTKDQYIIELNETIMSWLDETSPLYRKRKSRPASAVAYRKGVKFYIVRIITKIAAKN